MGTNSVESLVLKWLRRLPTCLSPFSDAAGTTDYFNA